MMAATFCTAAQSIHGGYEPMATEASEPLVMGKRWVEQTLQRMAGELNVPLGGLQWRDDFPGPYISSLYIEVQGLREKGAIEFRMRQLEDARNPANRPVRTSLEEQIRSGLQELRQKLG
jgi:hypothetical protein